MENKELSINSKIALIIAFNTAQSLLDVCIKRKKCYFAKSVGYKILCHIFKMVLARRSDNFSSYKSLIDTANDLRHEFDSQTGIDI